MTYLATYHPLLGSDCLLTTPSCIVASVKNPSDALVLQEDIQGLRCWSNENHLHFNQSKCKVLSITRKTSPLVSPYSLAGDLLSFSDAEVDRV